MTYIDRFEKYGTINGEYHAYQQDRGNANLTKNSPHLAGTTIISHQHNTKIQSFVVAMTEVNEVGNDLLLHRDLAPSGYFLFRILKTLLGGKRFGSDEHSW